MLQRPSDWSEGEGKTNSERCISCLLEDGCSLGVFCFGSGLDCTPKAPEIFQIASQEDHVVSGLKWGGVASRFEIFFRLGAASRMGRTRHQQVPHHGQPDHL